MANSESESELAKGIFMDYFNRNAEIIVKQSLKTYKSVLITGARQTGKSTLLKELFPKRRIITFDDQFSEQQARENPSEFIDLNPPPVTYDEVQYVPDLFRYIKIHCDNSKKNGLFCLTGSEPFKLMEAASESLAGRVAIVELSTLSLREIQKLDFKKPFAPSMKYIKARQSSAKKPANIWEIIHRGGYPALQNKKLNWEQYFANYIKTYLERDVRKLSAVQDLDTFRRFMIACAARTGQMLNYSNIASEISKDADTVKKWISILEASGIVYVLEPYANSVLNRAIKTPKLYFRDTGLACYLTRWLTTETLVNGAMSGAIFETFVVSEILKSYSNAGIDYRYCVSYYRGKDKKNDAEGEIDFIIEQDGILYPIEIKKTANPTADMTAAFTVLDKIPDKKRGTGAVVCMCSSPGVLRENVYAIPAWFI